MKNILQTIRDFFTGCFWFRDLHSEGDEAPALVNDLPGQQAGLTGWITTVNGNFLAETVDGEAVRWPFTVFQNESLYPCSDLGWFSTPNRIEQACIAAARLGFTSIFLSLGNQLHAGIGNYSSPKLSAAVRSSISPKAVARLKWIIELVGAQGMHVHVWPHGQKDSGTAPDLKTALDAAEVDYLGRIAEALGDLPWWSLGYGYDCEEWISEGVAAEIGNLWRALTMDSNNPARRPMIMIRGFNLRSLDVWSIGDRGAGLKLRYTSQLKSLLKKSVCGACALQERHTHLRTNAMTEEALLAHQRRCLALGIGTWTGYKKASIPPFEREEEWRQANRLQQGETL